MFKDYEERIEKVPARSKRLWQKYPFVATAWLLAGCIVGFIIGWGLAAW